MSVIRPLSDVLRAPRCRAHWRRICGAGLLLCYVAGTVGVPMPLGLAGPGGACRCSAESILAGQCCCRLSTVEGTCCTKQTNVPAEASVRPGAAKASAGDSCCRQQPSQHQAGDPPADTHELRWQPCSCGPGGVDGSLICTDPRLPAPAISVTGEQRILFSAAIESASAPSGALQPLTPPPRGV